MLSQKQLVSKLQSLRRFLFSSGDRCKAIMARSIVECSLILVYLIPAILSLPSIRPNSLSLTAPSNLNLDLNTTHHNITRLRRDPLDCIKKPRMYHIDIHICKPIMDRLLRLPNPEVDRVYPASTTQLGGSPCYIQLKRSWGKTSMQLSMEELVLTANDVLEQCAKYQGAGWAQFFPTLPWYLLVYGDVR